MQNEKEKRDLKHFISIFKMYKMMNICRNHTKPLSYIKKNTNTIDEQLHGLKRARGHCLCSPRGPVPEIDSDIPDLQVQTSIFTDIGT